MISTSLELSAVELLSELSRLTCLPSWRFLSPAVVISYLLYKATLFVSFDGFTIETGCCCCALCSVHYLVFLLLYFQHVWWTHVYRDWKHKIVLRPQSLWEDYKPELNLIMWITWPHSLNLHVIMYFFRLKTQKTIKKNLIKSSET